MSACLGRRVKTEKVNICPKNRVSGFHWEIAAGGVIEQGLQAAD